MYVVCGCVCLRQVKDQIRSAPQKSITTSTTTIRVKTWVRTVCLRVCMLKVSVTVRSGQNNPKPVSISFLYFLEKSRTKQRENDCNYCYVVVLLTNSLFLCVSKMPNGTCKSANLQNICSHFFLVSSLFRFFSSFTFKNKNPAIILKIRHGIKQKVTNQVLQRAHNENKHKSFLKTIQFLFHPLFPNTPRAGKQSLLRCLFSSHTV